MNNLIPRSMCGIRRSFIRHSPSILSGMAITGVITTAILSAKGTVKALDLLEKSREENSEELSNIEVAKIIAPAYIPAVAVCTFTVACIIGANNIANRRYAAILSAYALKNKKLIDYQEELGKEKVDEVESSIAKKKLDGLSGIECSRLNDGEQLFYERFSGRYFRSTLTDVVTAEYYMNQTFSERGYVYLNDFYLYLGIESTALGDDIGWSIDMMYENGYPYWIEFKNRDMPDGYTSIDYMCDPDPHFLDCWR